jgi:sugar phosphate isomerase/epimerase
MTLAVCHADVWDGYWSALGERPGEQLEASLAWTREAGFDAWQAPLPGDASGQSRLRNALANAGLGLVSMHATLRLHDPDHLEVSAATALRCAEAQALGLRLLVLRLAPIDPRHAIRKTEAQFGRQLRALDALGSALSVLGIGLAFLPDASTLSFGGREMDSVLAHAGRFGLCLDAEALLRAGRQPEQVLDLAAREHERLMAVHLRQTRVGIPQLALGDGDIDYRVIARRWRCPGFPGPLTFAGRCPGAVPASEMMGALRSSASWIKDTFEACELTRA